MTQRQAEVRSGADLGRALAELRRTLGMTQAQMADQAGISRAYLSAMESGRSTSLLDHYIRALRRAGARITVTFDDNGG